MLIDARELTPGQTLASQVCIIGAGAAGISLARALADRSIDVLLCEGGGFEPTNESTDLYRGSVSGVSTALAGATDDLTGSRLRYFGGSTNHWGGFCTKLSDDDFSARPSLGLEGWPITAESMVSHYERATAVIGLPHPSFEPISWPQMPEGADAVFDHPDLVTGGGQVFARRFGTEDRAAIVESPRITLALHASATQLNLQADSGRVDSVDLAAPGGVRFGVRAPIVVLAMGGIENPRLLLASNEVATAGIGNTYDQVGRYFSDHVSTLGGIVALGGDAGAWADLATPTAGKATLQRTVRLAPAIQEAEGLTSAGAIFVVQSLDAPEQAEGARLEDVDRWMQLVGSPPVGALAAIRVVAEQRPDADSRVTLNRKVDALGVPRVDLHWRQGATERRAIRRLMLTIGSAFGATGRARVQLTLGTLTPTHAEVLEERVAVFTIDPNKPGADDYELEAGNHHMSTTRMSASPRTGVVDSDCRVHGTTNLYVAGSSVFPSGGVAPPTLTIVALALRLAEHLATVVRP